LRPFRTAEIHIFHSDPGVRCESVWARLREVQRHLAELLAGEEFCRKSE
jgi:hypothetical protein